MQKSNKVKCYLIL